jgi:SAM-dependent methyltransferase
MKLRQRMFAGLAAQFGHPRGLGGHMAGWVMAHRPSNRERNRWAVSLLAVQPRDLVLEVGCGPGIAIESLARLVTEGRVCGLDRSAVMVHKAARRNSGAIRSGRVELRVGAIEDLPAFESSFDKILAVNSLGFWHEPVARLRELRGLLRAGGLIAIVSQPRCPGATDATSARAAEAIAAQLGDAGFSEIHVETLALRPAVVCVLGTNGARPSTSRVQDGAVQAP